MKQAQRPAIRARPLGMGLCANTHRYAAVQGSQLGNGGRFRPANFVRLCDGSGEHAQSSLGEESARHVSRNL